jgi:hypothetical protein
LVRKGQKKQRKRRSTSRKSAKCGDKEARFDEMMYQMQGYECKRKKKLDCDFDATG